MRSLYLALFLTTAILATSKKTRLVEDLNEDIFNANPEDLGVTEEIQGFGSKTRYDISRNPLLKKPLR